ncbi:hypothetical protein BON30_24875 [Cystobacter ferrugineus]|uniref:Uncharacterized protein n=1 Tax=Cystobacter ferrugineus TaxID=83449 RepID=A0A1L9B7Y8_9BACT|nr:hypothetical protein BON30_24875 [Cystobacter ferrugineus]
MVARRRQQVAAQPALLGVEPLEEAVLQQSQERFLHRVARGLGVQAMAAHVDVERAPVGAQQRLERRAARLRRSRTSCKVA